HALAPGLEIGPHYDAMLAKLIAYGPTREAARQQLMAAVERVRVLGVASNQAFLRELLAGEPFASGAATTDTIAASGKFAVAAPAARDWARAALLFVLREHSSAPYPLELRGFSNARGLASRLLLACEGEQRALRVAALRGGRAFAIDVEAAQLTLELAAHGS